VLAVGYSTFVVVPTDPNNPLPQAEADVIAVTLSSRAPSEAQYPPIVHSPRSSAALEDEDFELQAALQASLGGAAVQIPMPRPQVAPVASGTRARSPVAPGAFPPSPLVSPPPPVPHPSTRPASQPLANPVAASMARNQLMLERMRREQEAALREHYHDEASRFDGPPSRSHSAVGNPVVEDEEEQLRRAIEESEAMAREQGRTQTGSDAAGTTRARSVGAQAEEWRDERTLGGRVYDDEDAEFQAALQASLETAPPGVHTPDAAAATTPPRAPVMHRSPLPPAASRSGPRTEPHVTNEEGDDDDDDDMYFDDEDTATEETLSDAGGPPQAEGVSIEEMRRRRLARFGGP
jgi:ataxin-3